MIICICHNISENELKKVTKESSNPNEAIKKLGLGKSCGICLIDAIQKCFDSTRSTQDNISQPKTNSN